MMMCLRTTPMLVFNTTTRGRSIVLAKVARTRSTTTSTNTTRLSSSSSSSTTTAPPTDFPCDVVQGPSILRTSVCRPSPSLIFLPGLRSMPFWTRYEPEQKQTKVAYNESCLQYAVELLETNYATILEEYQNVSPQLSSDYKMNTADEHSLHEGQWDWYSYLLKGQIQNSFIDSFPQTSAVLQTLRDDNMLFDGTPFGYAFFSTLHGNSNIAAHSAPMNFRVRVHLPLIVPTTTTTTTTGSSADGNDNNTEEQCGIRVGPIKRRWIPGKCLLLDDAYDHEVWNTTQHQRTLLLVDLWHPDVTHDERQNIIQLFQHAKEQGWLGSSSSSDD